MIRLGSAIALAAAAVLVPTAQAHAATLACGDTVTADVVLTRNLTCTGTALRVNFSAPGAIHIDLNGHRISGNGTGIGIDSSATTSPSGDLTVSGGTIRGFSTALVGGQNSVPTLQNLTVDGVTLRSNGSWSSRAIRRQVNVLGSTIVDSGLGGAYTDSGTLTVRDSTFTNSGIASSSESYNFVYDSAFNGGGFVHGAAANVVATGNTFKNCNVAVNATDVFPGSPTRIEGNKFTNCSLGVNLVGFAGTATVKDNVFKGNTTGGITFSAGSNLTVDISGNRLTDNGGDGIQGTGTALVTVANNRAVGNGGHGINVTGVTDGGGNVAKNNATSPQCIGVVCTP